MRYFEPQLLPLARIIRLGAINGRYFHKVLDQLWTFTLQTLAHLRNVLIAALLPPLLPDLVGHIERCTLERRHAHHIAGSGVQLFDLVAAFDHRHRVKDTLFQLLHPDFDKLGF